MLWDAKNVNADMTIRRVSIQAGTCLLAPAELFLKISPETMAFKPAE